MTPAFGPKGMPLMGSTSVGGAPTGKRLWLGGEHRRSSTYPISLGPGGISIRLFILERE
jgi:hypothetical protein